MLQWQTFTKNENKHCPLDEGDINIAGMPITVDGDRTPPDSDVQCAIKMLQRQIGIKAGFTKCTSCGVNVQAGKFGNVSSGSLTRNN